MPLPLPGFVQTILDNGVVKARIKAGIASASIAVGAWTLSHMYDWLSAHATFFSHATDVTIATTIATCFAGLVGAFYGILYPQADASNVDAKLQTAAVTGNVKCADNPKVVQKVKDAAGSPEALNDLVAKLNAGHI